MIYIQKDIKRHCSISLCTSDLYGLLLFVSLGLVSYNCNIQYDHYLCIWLINFGFCIFHSRSKVSLERRYHAYTNMPISLLTLKLLTNLFRSSNVVELTQNFTNGNSLWGTLEASQLAPFLTDNPMLNGRPWGDRDAYKSHPHNGAPYTGKTRYYDFTISRGKLSPDGFEKEVILVNGQYPGPLIEANWGDTIQVTVHNKITNPSEGTAMHWHGLLMRDTPWYDGVPGYVASNFCGTTSTDLFSITQCPIAPGSSFTYRFQADSYGTTWYCSTPRSLNLLANPSIFTKGIMAITPRNRLQE